jgi:flavin reductase (DIM6/NTAB) family NADH-FMN oxidoreductase RutF
VAGHGPVGPFPEGVDPDEYDRRRRRVLWSLTTGLYVLGTAAGGRRNLMTLNWATQVATEPKLVAVSVEAGAVSHDLIQHGRGFTLNLIHRQDRALVRKFVKPLDDEGAPSSLGGHAVSTAVTGSPILDSAVSWLDCRLHSEHAYTSHSLFVGEVVDCAERSEQADALRMEDTRMSYGG